MTDFFFYLKLGWEHIISLDALDHQLFILVLIAAYFYKDWRKILLLVTAFTIGHSVTLAFSVLDVFRLPSALVETLIPVTIMLTALDNILFREKREQLMKINYFLALVFGLIHGMGFANTARMAMAAEQNIAIPLLGFNIGLELGQITVVLIVMALLYLLSKFLKFQQKYWIIGVSFLAIILSGQMILERI
ncbi:HupE/UreJ family protein [Kaistella polysaccharea]|uniref:HupE/UreJ family protein n=1 Tax=Kaistella polysaccharea TaxID=2878534 RepID=UPI001CF11928|nr:HupE/UreJ family protein [Kaistella polysaccharea]